MAIHGTTGYCTACQKDTLFERDRWSPDDAPLLCPAGHNHAEFAGQRDMKANTGIIEKHDPYTYPNENGVWFRGKAGITTDQARMIQARNRIRRDWAKRTASGGRLKASIPAALFYGQLKTNGMDYWKDQKNIDRVSKDWAVHEDKQ